MILLDWEKAFDKLTHAALFKSMKRMGIHQKLIRLVQVLYQDPTFYVEIDGTKSAKDFTIKKWKRFIRKRALKRVEKLMTYAQKQPEDYTKEEMRKLIEKEENEVISNLKATVGLSSVLLLLGIPKL